jgi:branched-chain amino acid transport system permease protein
VRGAAAAFLAVVLVLAGAMGAGDFWVSVADYVGIYAVAAVGLNLLTGYTGQVSLGHAFFMGAGAYAAVALGGHMGLPLPLWLLGAGAVGGCLGVAAGPFALRLRGNYLAVVSLGLVFVGLHVFANWRSLTGGPGGTAVVAAVRLGPLDFARPRLAGAALSRNQGFLCLIWGVVAVSVALERNIVRSRPGRALQAIRDRELVAESCGVGVARYKVGAFALSGALAAVAGALLGAYQQFVQPGAWDLALSVQFVAMVVIGGIGTVWGPVLGAAFVAAVPRLVEHFSGAIPFVARGAGGNGLSVAQLNQILFGLLILGFLLFEPRGLAAFVPRLRAGRVVAALRSAPS